MEKLPPGHNGSRLLQTLRYAKDSLAEIDSAHAKYGKIFSMRVLGGENWVFVTEPADVKALLTADIEVAVAGENNKAYFEPLTGDSTMFVLDGQPHLRRRRLLMPSFSGDRMQSYAAFMYERAIAKIDSWPMGKTFSLVPEMQELSLDVITRAAFGVDESTGLPALIRDLANSAFSSPFLFLRWLRFDWGVLSPWGRIVKKIRATDKAIYAEIQKRRDHPIEGDASMLAMLLAAKDEDGRPMSDKEIRDELITMLVAGHETTATSIAWAVERILSHPEIANALRQEVAGIDNPAALAKLPLLDAALKESLRMRPIFPATGNRRLKAPLALAGYTIPAGTVCSIALNVLHREAYDTPSTFSTDRFLGKTPDPYTWLGFGGGTRRCIGMHFALFEMKIILGALLQRNALALVTPNVPHAYKGITIHPKDGLKVRRI